MPGKASKVSKVKKAPKKVEEVPAPVEDVVAPAPDDVVSETPFVEEFAELSKMAEDFLAMARSFKQNVQKLEKRVHKEHKVLLKKSRGKRRRQTDPNAPPSGFAKPGPVSDELRKFLKLGKEDLIARTEVTKAINAYCKEHGLQNGPDKRKILADAPLRKLLKLNKNDELTFFNLQTYLKVHFPNKDGVYPTL
tara:strand:- start:573 stop:1151 length:579 start_codon:yes stop_codon:yes gene_type:complete